MRRVFIHCNGICTRTKFGKIAQISADTYRKRFGGWQNVLVEFRKWLEKESIEFPFFKGLPLESEKIEKLTNQSQKAVEVKSQSWTSLGGTTYGHFLNFRGLLHAPVNEQGVVFLFGMICLELGFVVEGIRTQYPDCEAKRRIDVKMDKWEKVSIEFEFLSKNFKEHGHNPDLCNVIVCWEHNWKECPLEVIELKSVIKKLPSK